MSMLARLTLLLVAIPALALAAASDGAPGGGRLKVAAPAPAARPEQAQPAANALPRLAAPPPATQAEPSECRMGCAQTYYFCRAGDHADDCAPTWGQCVASCNSPALSPGVSTAP
jgi:hypothetical protein